MGFGWVLLVRLLNTCSRTGNELQNSLPLLEIKGTIEKCMGEMGWGEIYI